jgi:hypothetical protein
MTTDKLECMRCMYTWEIPSDLQLTKDTYHKYFLCKCQSPIGPGYHWMRCNIHSQYGIWAIHNNQFQCPHCFTESINKKQVKVSYAPSGITTKASDVFGPTQSEIDLTAKKLEESK